MAGKMAGGVGVRYGGYQFEIHGVLVLFPENSSASCTNCSRPYGISTSSAPATFSDSVSSSASLPCSRLWMAHKVKIERVE